jgi:hypothetical protein
VAQHLQDTMGLTIAGPDRFLVSGHSYPSDAGPSHLGLVASDDGGNTWIPVGLSGQADFHALSAALVFRSSWRRRRSGSLGDTPVTRGSWTLGR